MAQAASGAATDALVTRSPHAGITYKLQERPLGGLSKVTLRKLESFNAKTNADKLFVAPVSLKPGTRLVREWRGATHSVLVDSDGFEWNGELDSSLTLIAEKITGAHWSGPRFFGLRRLTGASSKSAESGHAEA
ncbi:MAG: DUF2924 domain-containing protein [Methylocystis sp.]|uniref:DUF2924 domain-containing protein n=1 Tax=Methylocystis sp. TaxID=1911079 RepID=UPI003DA2894F